MNLKSLSGSILVPIDFTETSIFALEHAAAISTLENSAITLIHVIEGASFEPVTHASDVKVDQNQALAIEGAAARLQKIIDNKTSNISYKYIIVGGKPYRAIADTADEIKADFIVMGTNGSSGMQAFAGSNASKVIQYANCPVIVVREHPVNKGYKNIVLPLDLTAETKQKVTLAADLAEHFNSTVHIVSLHEKDEFLANKLNANLNQVEEYLKDRGIATTATDMSDSSGNFAMRTLDWAKAKNADLVMIMTQQERSVREYIIGTYAQQIVNKSPIAVLTVTPNTKLEGSVDISNPL